MDWDERITDVNRAVLLQQRAAAEGPRFGADLMHRPRSSWRRLMRTDPRYRSYGTLDYLLDEARKRFENEPTVAYEITSAVIDVVDSAEGAPSHIHAIALRGRAWKEHANALECIGDLPGALDAAKRAIAIFGESGALKFDETKARLVECNIYRDLGNTEEALRIARECAVVFADFAEAGARTMARMCEGTILFTLKRFKEALGLFTDLIRQAEIEGDTLILARGLHNAAECARELGDLVAARDLYPRALAYFEELGLTSEATRVRWGGALAVAAEGSMHTAVSELFKVRGVYLHLGMNCDAATAALDIVRIRFDAGEDVRALSAELVATFTTAGMTQNAIEALAYLREQAKEGTITANKITAVRTYFGELSRRPSLLFIRPSDNESA